MLAIETLSADPLGLFIAFCGGFVSVLSPCVLPILPGMFSMVSGLSLDELRSDKHLFSRVIRLCLLFSIGFTGVYVVIGLATTQVSDAFITQSSVMTRIGGVVILVLAAFLALGQLSHFRFFMTDTRPFFKEGVTSAGAIATGAAFGFGWTPCIGPIMAAVLTYAATEHALIARVSILFFYCAGLCVALTAMVYSFFRFNKIHQFLKRHMNIFMWTSIIAITLFGIVLTLNEMSWVTAKLTQFLDFLGLDSLVTIG